MSDIATLNRQLDDMILQGQAMDAFEQYYADDVVMQENTDEPLRGKDANRKREEEFFGSVEELHGAKLLGSAAADGKAFSEWEWDVTFKGVGRITMTQVAAREWKDGRVTYERFYYNKG